MKTEIEQLKTELDICQKTVWIKYECDNGARWTAVKGGMCETRAGKCRFSGCPNGHNYHRAGETTNRHEAHEWFNRPEEVIEQ